MAPEFTAQKLSDDETQMESHDSIFDKFMEMAGDDGPFQRRFNYIFNAGMVVFASLAYMNVILALNVPEHWCHVPGREFTNYTIEEWKHITLPRCVSFCMHNAHSLIIAYLPT